MTVQPWTNKGIHNKPCDRCGSTQDPVLRGYGFADNKNGLEKGYSLCRFCAEKWEELISNKVEKMNWRNPKWRNCANKLLKDFVLGIDNEPERVEFT